MRQRLVRSTVLAVVLSVIIVGLPLFLAAWYGVADDAQVLREWLNSQRHSGQILMILAAIVVLSVIAVAVGVLVASRQARKFAEPMTGLAERAERLGAGQSRLEPLVSGIAEIDAVSDVLARSAQQLTRSLASERDFAADASHQLRTPLTALLMRLEEIGLTDDLDVVREEAGIAIAQVERLTRVVDDLMSRTRRGHQDAPTPSVSLDSIIAALQREWQPAFEQARRSVRVHGQRGPGGQVDAGRAVPGAVHAAGELAGPRPWHRRRARPPQRPLGRRRGQRPGRRCRPDDRPAHLRALGHQRRYGAWASPSPATSPSPTAAGSS